MRTNKETYWMMKALIILIPTIIILGCVESNPVKTPDTFVDIILGCVESNPVKTPDTFVDTDIDSINVDTTILPNKYFGIWYNENDTIEIVKAPGYNWLMEKYEYFLDGVHYKKYLYGDVCIQFQEEFGLVCSVYFWDLENEAMITKAEYTLSCDETKLIIKEGFNTRTYLSY